VLRMTQTDISQLSYQEFADFFFSRPGPARTDVYAKAAFPEAWDCSRADIAVTHLTALFRDFARIGRRFTIGQIDQALWELLSPGQELPQCLWDESVPIPERLECIRAMYSVFSDFVATCNTEQGENCFYMWWDFIADSFWFQPKHFGVDGKLKIRQGEVEKLDASDHALLDAMFETLEEILALPDARTKSYALHGLGHLHHPGVQALVQRHIDQYRDSLTPEDLKWAEQCRDGSVI
jgi:hypothetical protein